MYIDDVKTIISLLTLVIALLTIVIVVLIATIAVLLVKFRKLMDEAHEVTHNVAAVTKWLDPSKVFAELANVFRK